MRLHPMKIAFALAGLLMLFAGCATAKQTVTLNPCVAHEFSRDIDGYVWVRSGKLKMEKKIYIPAGYYVASGELANGMCKNQ